MRRVTLHPGNEPAPLAYRLAEATYELHAALERHLHDTLVELDLTIPLSDAIWQLDPKLGPVSRRELAERLQCDPSNVTFLVDRLESRGLLTRARARSDRRIKALAHARRRRSARPPDRNDRRLLDVHEPDPRPAETAGRPAPTRRRPPAVIALRLHRPQAVSLFASAATGRRTCKPRVGGTLPRRA